MTTTPGLPIPPVELSNLTDPSPPKINIALVFLAPYGLLIFGSLVGGILAGLIGLSVRWLVTGLQVGAVIVPTVLLFRYYRISMKDMAAVRLPSPIPLLGLVFFLAGLVVMEDTLMYTVMEIAPTFLVNSFKIMLQAQAEIMAIEKLSEYLWYLVVVVLGAGVFEELLFRGLLLRACLQHMPATPSIILNGIFFGIMHQSIIGFTYYFLLGASLAYVAIRTRTLVYGIFLHCTLNLAAALLARQFGVLMRLPLPAWIAVIGGTAACVGGMALFVATTRPRPDAPVQ